MIKILMKKMKTVREWSVNNKTKYNPQRNNVKICVIDDNGIDENKLKKMGYNNVTAIKEYVNKEIIKPFDVVVCDINGIGNEIDPKRQGIAVALDIKKVYPEKIVILYSGENPIDYDENLDFKTSNIDGFIKKGISTKDFVDQLDIYCSPFWNPIDAWKFAEKNLRDEQTPNKIIAYLEHIYVKSIEKNKNYVNMYVEKNNTEDVVKLSIAILNFLSKIILVGITK